MSEYLSAAHLGELAQSAKEMGKEIVSRTIRAAPWVGAAYAIARKYPP